MLMGKNAKLLLWTVIVVMLLGTGLFFLNYKNDEAGNLPENLPNGGSQNSQNLYQTKIDKTISAFGINVIPLSIVEDSRCPVDVQCIQAGTVRVDVQISDGIEYMKRTLNLGDVGAAFGDISISLKAVSPAPNSKITIKPSDYVLTFEIKNTNQTVSASKILDYTNNTYGLSFSYTDSYILDEEEVGNGERSHYTITLSPKSAFPLPAGGEGPPTITIDVYQNNLGNLSLDSWLRNTNFSNFKLSDGKYTDTTISGSPAVRYHWSGLYEANTLAFIHKKSIIAISGMYLSQNDEVVKDFNSVVSSFKLK